MKHSLIILSILFLIILTIIIFLKSNSRHQKEHFQSPPKLAFCFLCYGQPKHTDLWKNFFDNNSDKYSIYLHPKYLSKVADPFFKNKIIKNRIPTQWGDVSLVEATLNLFAEAYKDSSNQKFILLSDACLPLYNFDYIYQKLLENKMTYIHHLGWDSEAMKNNRYQKLKNQEQIPLKHFRKQSQWLILDRNDYKFIVEHNNLNDYRKMFAPDEQYFINLFDQYQRKYNNQVTTYVDWESKSSSPREFDRLDPEIIDRARARGAFFIRKIKKEAEISQDYLFSDTNESLTIHTR